MHHITEQTFNIAWFKLFTFVHGQTIYTTSTTSKTKTIDEDGLVRRKKNVTKESCGCLCQLGYVTEYFKNNQNNANLNDSTERFK